MPEELEDPVALRALDDIPALRKAVDDKVFSSIQSKFPVENQKYRLELSDLGWSGPKDFSIAEQKEAILKRRTLGRKLKGTWNLIDKATGQSVDKQTKMVASVPYMTQDGVFIHNGGQYTLANQSRVKPGVYSRQKENGELESVFNVQRGKSFRISMEPETGVFKMSLDQGNIPLLPVLRALGVDDKQLEDALGKELLAKNTGIRAEGDAVIRAALRMGSEKLQALKLTPQETLRQALDATRIDRRVMQRNLGLDTDRVTPGAMLGAAKKLLQLNRGEVDFDDRDDQANQQIMGPEDLLAERITKDAGGLVRNLLWKATRHGSLKAMPASALTPQLHSAILYSGLGTHGTETNPVEILDQHLRITRLGEGGITSKGSIPMESRNQHPSQLGFIDPIFTVESSSVGVDVRAATGTLKGSDGRLYSQMRDARTGKIAPIAAEDVWGKVVAFPGELDDPKAKLVRASVKGKLTVVPRDQVDYVPPAPERMFSTMSNLVPGFSGEKGGRHIMGSRMIKQALPLEHGEAPHVQSSDDDGVSFESKVGNRSVVRAKSDGRVLEVTPDAITVSYGGDGKDVHQLYNNFPYNYATFIHHTPAVKAGDTVKSGQMLAHANFTDKDGTLALGKNLKVAYLPFSYKGAPNHEDAIIISETAAKKLAAERMHQVSYEPGEGKEVDRGKFLGMYPSKYTRDQLSMVGDDGVVKQGTVVNEGDPLILAVGQRKTLRSQAVHATRHSAWADDSVTWDKSYPGTVTDTYRDDDGQVKVIVKGVEPMHVGDKLAGTFGDKGIVSAVVPDTSMPHDQGGEPTEIVVNPLGITSRVNHIQVVAAALGKIAAKTGKPYLVRPFQGDWANFAKTELAKNGMKLEEDVHDPETGRTLKDVAVGNRFYYRLMHSAEGKEGARDEVGGYTAEDLPSKGEEGNSKRLGLLDTNALLSMGATNVLKDAKLVRGQRNDDFWDAFRRGLPTPPLHRPMVYDKFLAYLKGAGVNVQEKDGDLNFGAMTDSDIKQLAPYSLTSGDAVDRKTGEAVPGGLFDTGMTGGHHGQRWSSLPLQEKMPSPIMEDPLRRLLGLTVKEYREQLAKDPAELEQKVGGIDVGKEWDRLKQQIPGLKGQKRDDAIRKLGYLDGLKKTGVDPKSLFWSAVPVVPPMFRPVSIIDGMQLTSDANLMYKELFSLNDNLKDAKEKGMPLGEHRLAVYDAIRAAVGRDNSVNPELENKNVGGLLAHVFGKDTNKTGLLQRRMVGSSMVGSGKAVFSPDDSLDVDDAGIPENTAWQVYKPFILRRLSQQYNAGASRVPVLELAKWVENRDPRARQAMDKEMEERPILMTRAPVWHRYGYMAFNPKIRQSSTIALHPFVLPGFGADADGDVLSYSVPVTAEAVKDAREKMMPSRNLLAVNTFKPHMGPRQEYLIGLYLATQAAKKAQPRSFLDRESAVDAYHRGELGLNDPVQFKA